MAFTFGFYNSMNGDRRYNAEQISAIFDGLIQDGVFHSIGEIFGTVPGDGMQVVVKSGRAWFNHTWNANDAGYPLNLAQADVSLPRYDAVVLEVNSEASVRTNRLKVVTGMPATNPVKPAMIDTLTQHQHALAYVLVPPATSAVTPTNIQIVVGTSETPFSTGILTSASIDDLFQQWEGQFDEWFENLKAQLTDNVVANLQKQIDERVKIADKATVEDAKAGTNDTKWMTPLKTQLTVNASSKARPGDRVTEISKVGEGNFVPCTGGLIDKKYSASLRGALAAHDFYPFNSFGADTSTIVGGFTAWNNVLMAANDDVFVVAAGAGSVGWFTASSLTIQVAENFSIFTTSDPDIAPFTNRVTVTREACIGLGYDETTSKFWAVSLYLPGAVGSTHHIRVRVSTDGINWPVYTGQAFNITSYILALISPVANGGKLAIVKGGLAVPGETFNLSTLTFTTFAWPVTANRNPGFFYMSEDGLHLAFYDTAGVYISDNGGMSWAVTTVFMSYSSICYSSTCGWIARSGVYIYRTINSANVWTRGISLGVISYTYLHVQKNGRVYMYISSDTLTVPSLRTTTDGITWTTLSITDLFGIAPPTVNAFFPGEPLMQEIDGKILLGVSFERYYGNWFFGLIDGDQIVHTATISLGFGMTTLSAKSYTYDKISKTCHYLFYATTSAPLPTVRAFTSCIINNKIVIEMSPASNKSVFPAMDVPFVGVSNNAALFSIMSQRSVSLTRIFNGNSNGIYQNNPTMAINFKGDWKAYSSIIRGDQTAGQYVAFYIAGSSLCARRQDGMFLCLEGG